MKKIALVLAMLLVVPCAAFGIEVLNDTAMDDVTGQAGVSIAFDDVQLFINVDTIAWLDADGFASTDSFGALEGDGGAVGMVDFQLDVLNVNAITGPTGASDDFTSVGQFDVFFDYGDTSALGGPQLAASAATELKGLDNYTTGSPGKFRALSIDATSQLPVSSTGKANNYGGAASMTVGGVLIGIPTAEMYIPSMKLTPVFFDVDGETSAINAYGTGALVPGATYGTIVMEGITFTTLTGWMEIAPH